MEREKERRIVIAGGGTGGHVFPALAVAGELRSRHPGAGIVFVGGRRGLEQSLVPAAGFPLRTLPLGGLKGQRLAGRLRSALAAGWALLRCAAWMIRSRPDLVIGVGGYASGPAVLAARTLGVATMILEQNHLPGATNRWLAPRVDAVCVPSAEAAERLRGRCFVTGNPVRAEFAGLDEAPGGDALSLLVFGGSRGARSINDAMVAALPELSRNVPPPFVVHQTGPAFEQDVRAAYAADYPAGRYEVHAFLDDMPQRFEAADLVVSRAGATTIAELAAAGRPSILVPYPFAADDHQAFNARALERAGAAAVIADDELGSRLASTIRALAGDRGRRHLMAHAARGLARIDATRRISDIADALLDGRSPNGGEARETADVS